MSGFALDVQGFVLHSRPFQENSAIVQIFSPQAGRFSLVAKGLNSKRSQARKALLQPFKELQLSCVGRSDLKTLVTCEASETNDYSALSRYSDRLACGFYANELLVRSLSEQMEAIELYASYVQLLKNLLQQGLLAEGLRHFEVDLLAALGVEPDWFYDAENQPVDKQKSYCFKADAGFYQQLSQIAEPPSSYQVKPGNEAPSFAGNIILALGLRSFELQAQELKDCQRLTRLLLRPLIGDKPLQSRKLWHRNH